MTTDGSPAERAEPRPLALPELRAYLAARFLILTAIQAASVAIGWQVFAWTHDPLMLGLVGLAQFAPMMLLTPWAGDLADRRPRRGLAIGCALALAASLGAMTASSAMENRSVLAALGVAAAFGMVRAVASPALAALLAEVVPLSLLPRTVALASSGLQIALVAGPALGGFLFAAFGATATYATSTTLLVASAGALAALSPRPAPEGSGKTKGDYLAGLRFVWSRPVLLGAMSLDLFAVLLGGAVALLPAVVDELLHAGPRELGFLRSAPAIGAAIVGVVLSRRPLERRVGALLLVAVAIYGASMIGFGLSRSYPLSLALLLVSGASDMVSVFIRQSLVQLETPDAMRGRVSAVSQLFIGGSNELGELESGLAAKWLGVTRAIVFGGIGTIAVVLAWARLFPGLRRADRFSSGSP